MKKTLLTLVAAAFALTVGATPLSPDQALQRLQGERAGSRFAPAAMTLAYTAAETEQPAYYVFNAKEGYVIAGADDLAAPMLGYVDHGSFDYSNIPDQMRWWLSQYAAELEHARIAAQGADLSRVVKMERPTRPAVQPLVYTTWNQSTPYNDLAPLYDGTNRAASGCVATAMSQVLRFYKYPVKGVGSNSYTYGGITNSFNFGTTTFDWANMIHSYTTGNYNSTQATAVATLMRACAVGVNMMYGASSGAYSKDVPIALINYFSYSPSAYLANREVYDLYTWEDMIYAELARQHPVYYAGHGTAGGHAFVCDGYDEDGYFHFNWGWGGSSDGYFLLTALNPTTLGIGGGGGGFNLGQGAILDLRPTTQGTRKVYLCYNSSYTISVSGSTVTLTGFGGNFGTSTLSSVRYCYRLTNVSDPTKVLILQGNNTASNLQVNYGYNSNTLSITSSNRPANGTYVIEPMFQVREGSTGSYVDYDANIPPSMKGKYLLTVNGSSLSVATQETTKPAVTNFQINGDLFSGGYFNYTATYSNSGTTDFYAPFYIGWFNSSNSLIGVGDEMQTDIMPGETRQESVTIQVPTKVNVTSSTTANLSVGTSYKIALLYSNGTNYVRLSDYVPVTIKASQGDFNLTCSNLMVDNSSAANANDVRFSLDLTAQAGKIYNMPLYFWARELQGGTYVSIYNGSTDPVIVNGTTKTHVEWRFPFTQGVVGKTYQLILNYRPASTNKYLGATDFTIGTAGVDGIPTIEDVYSIILNGDNATVTAPRPIKTIEVYNMSGIRQTVNAEIAGNQAIFSASGLQRGIYLVRVITANGVKTLRLVK